MMSKEDLQKPCASQEIITKVLKCDPKCIHDNEKICSTSESNTSIVKKIPGRSSYSSSQSNDTDSLHSGESAFKTFSFELDDDDPELKKCMAFWKSVLAKNMKPIKCTLIQPKKVREKKKKDEVKKETDEQNDKMWLKMYKELQKRKLDKLRLVKNEKCRPCDEYIIEEDEKKQDKEDIKELNNWKANSKSEQKTKIDVNSQVKRTLQVLHTSRTETKPKDKIEKIVPKSDSEKKVLPIKSQPLIEKPTTVQTPKAEIVPNIISNAVKESAIKSEKTETAHHMIVEDTENKMQESKTIVEDTKSMSCCKCGCDTAECICRELEEILVSNDEFIPKTQPCGCGCQIRDCICDQSFIKTDFCSCGCTLKDCICETFETKCTCGCGLDDCLCEQLYTRSCQCGHSDCNCDMIEVLNAYLESLDTPCTTTSVTQRDKGDSHVVSTLTQTEEEKWILETMKEEGSYCIICGHFNCHCNAK